jgi:predicted O-methyltransferase YrrM
MLSRMLDAHRPTPPAAWAAIDQDTRGRAFNMASDVPTGALLRTLAASKAAGALLELGTGTGLATAWLLDGMDERSTLLSMDNDEGVVSVARRHLGHDRRLTLVVQDGASFLASLLFEGKRFDLVFADTWPGKYTNLDDALSLVKVGGFYVIDDMLPQPNWTDDHPPKVEALVRTLGSRPDFQATSLHWSTGLMIATRVATGG